MMTKCRLQYLESLRPIGRTILSKDVDLYFLNLANQILMIYDKTLKHGLFDKLIRLSPEHLRAFHHYYILYNIIKTR